MAFPGTYNFNYYKGDTFEIIVKPKTSDGNPIDLTDFDSDFIIAGDLILTDSFLSSSNFGSCGKVSFKLLYFKRYFYFA